MSEPIDLMSAVQAAFYQALAAGVPEELAEVFDTVPQGKNGSYVQVGEIDSENEGDKDEQRERFEVTINSSYFGKNRPLLLAIMHAVRTALDGEPLAFEGVSFSTPEYVGASAGSTPIMTPNGLLYGGATVFEIYAEPA